MNEPSADPAKPGAKTPAAPDDLADETLTGSAEPSGRHADPMSETRMAPSRDTAPEVDPMAQTRPAPPTAAPVKLTPAGAGPGGNAVDSMAQTRPAEDDRKQPAIDPLDQTRAAPPTHPPSAQDTPGATLVRPAGSTAGDAAGSAGPAETYVRPPEHTIDQGNTSLLPPLMDDMQKRWQKGDRVFAESYLHSHPSLQTDRQSAWRLVESEISLRQSRGEALALEEYLRRFPNLAPEIKSHFRSGPAADSDKTPPMTLASGWQRKEGTATTPDSPLGETLGHAAAPPREAVKQVIGDYEILGVLGRGGMGVVYKARQRRLNRIVALKMVLSGAHASDDDLRRFKFEAEASARLQHPNIVQIYEVGEVDGKPFFSLEYVDGGSLASKLAGEPQAPFPTAQLVEILARAMHFAHQRGVVHRDLKPANILLAPALPGAASTAPLSVFGIPKITDFGLAKRMDLDLKQTHTGAILGTPSYMAPEQASGRVREIGPGTDIYALGAILYDLLTGRPPFKANTLADTLHQVQMAEPVSPTRLQPQVPRDLAVICLKCLTKEPGRRYQTALALAEDLGRFQTGEPIQARPAGMIERAVKWSKRRPTAAALIAVSVLSFLAMGIGGWWFALSLYSANQKTEKARLLAERNQARAENRQDMALKAVDGMLYKVASVDLAEIPQMEKTRTDLLQQAVRLFKEIPPEEMEDAPSRFLAGRTDSRLGEVEQLLSHLAPAQAALTRAETTLQGLCAEFPDNKDYRRELARAEHGLGKLLLDSGQNKDAAAVLGEALKQREELVKESPNDPLYLQDQASSAYWLGATQKRLRMQNEAKANYQVAIELQKKLAANAPAGPEGNASRIQYESDEARYLNNLGILQGDTGQPNEAIATLETALAIQERLAEKRPDMPSLRRAQARTVFNLGFLLWQTEGKRLSGEAKFDEALKLLDRLVKDFPRVPAYRSDMATLYRTRGNLYQEKLAGQAKPDESQKAPATGETDEQVTEKAFRDALALHEGLVREFDKMPEYQKELGRDYLSLGQFLKKRAPVEAAKMFNQALDVQKTLVKNFPDSAEYHADLSRTLGGLADRAFRHSFPPGSLTRVETDWILALACQACAAPAGLLVSADAISTELVQADCWYGHETLHKRAHDEARGFLLEAIAQMKKAHELEPRRPEYSRDLSSQLKDLGNFECVVRDHVRAAQVAKEIGALETKNPESQVTAAEFVARAFTLLRGDGRLSPEARKELENRYAAQALADLQKAMVLGWKDPRVFNNPVWNALRTREEIQAVIKKMETQSTTTIQ